MSRAVSTSQTMFLIAVLAVASGQAAASGALAIDTNQGGRYGFSYGQADASAAEDRALEECGADCGVVLDFESGCGAYAADQAPGSTAFGWGTAGSGSEAQERAIRECESKGGRVCVVRAWGCE